MTFRIAHQMIPIGYSLSTVHQKGTKFLKLTLEVYRVRRCDWHSKSALPYARLLLLVFSLSFALFGGQTAVRDDTPPKNADAIGQFLLEKVRKS